MKTKKNRIKLFTVLAIVASTVFMSCSSNSNDDNPQEELSEVVMQDFVKNVNSMAVPSTLANSNNSFAQQANAQFQAVKAIGSSFTALFNIPVNAVKAKSTSKVAAKNSALNSKTYTWSADGTTVKYTITDNSDRYSFTYHITSQDFTGKLMDGYQLKDGSYAEANLFAGGSSSEATIKWWLNDNVSKVEVNLSGNRLVLESNLNDNSGNLKIYEASSLLGLYEWNADGSGKFIDYTENETYTW